MNILLVFLLIKYIIGETIRGIINVYGYPKDSEINKMPIIKLTWKCYQTVVMHTIVTGFNTDFQCRKFFFDKEKKYKLELFEGNEENLLTTKIIDFCILPTSMPVLNVG
jgi:hypothetical protein